MSFQKAATIISVLGLSELSFKKNTFVQNTVMAVSHSLCASVRSRYLYLAQVII